jgi:predicted ABC-type ATPase
MPNLYVIAGPNGAGKTTFAKEFLPHYAKCNNFINADLIAQGLSPFSPQAEAIKAGRLLLEQIHLFSKRKVNFAFETTLSGKTYISLFKNLKRQGYASHLFFLWIPHVQLALARIKDRVANGGHDVPAKDVQRRYVKSLYNFFNRYQSLFDSWALFDNSTSIPHLIAEEKHGSMNVLDKNLFEKISKIREK